MSEWITMENLPRCGKWGFGLLIGMLGSLGTLRVLRISKILYLVDLILNFLQKSLTAFKVYRFFDRYEPLRFCKINATFEVLFGYMPPGFCNV